MIAPAGSFAHSWTAEILPQRPMILPGRHYVYPAQVEEVELGALEVLVRPRSVASGEDGPRATPPFLATCALGFRDPAAPTGIWAMPDPDWLCAVSGGYAYLIDTACPERFTHVRYRPVLQIHPCVSAGLLLLAGHHSILAWGRDGEAWESDRLSWEGVTIDRIEDATVHGTGWDLMTDADLAFTLDLTTGKRLQVRFT
jgi:hypothetical protein